MTQSIFKRSLTPALLCAALVVPFSLTACGDSTGGETSSTSAANTEGGSTSASATQTDGSTPAETATTSGTDSASSSTGGDTSTASTTGDQNTTDTATTSDDSTSTEPKNLVDLAKSDADFTTLVELITLAEDAELNGLLTGTDAMTVFAPTNAAFNKLDAAKLTEIKGDKAMIKSILMHHVIDTAVKSDTLSGVTTQTSKGGATLLVDATNGVVVGGATVVKPDLEASNGVIHGVDTVIMPPTKTIKELAAENTDLSTLNGAIDTANLADTLNGTDKHTVFAPTNAAFEAFTTGGGTVPTDPADLANFLKYHVLSGETFSAQLQATQDVDTLLANQKQTITKNGDTVKYGAATVTTKDIQATNGIIHVIDAVVEPSVSKP